MDPELSTKIFPDYTLNLQEVLIWLAKINISNSGCLDTLREGFAWSITN